MSCYSLAFAQSGPVFAITISESSRTFLQHTQKWTRPGSCSPRPHKLVVFVHSSPPTHTHPRLMRTLAPTYTLTSADPLAPTCAHSPGPHTLVVHVFIRDSTPSTHIHPRQHTLAPTYTHSPQPTHTRPRLQSTKIPFLYQLGLTQKIQILYRP